MKIKQRPHLHSLSIGLIGAGALGNALAQRLSDKGFTVSAIVSRTSRSARLLASKTKCKIAGIDFSLLRECNFIIITVPDSQIRHVGKKLQNISFRHPETTVVHTSGTLTSSTLGKLKQNKRHNIYVASMHPMQSFPKKKLWNKETLAKHFRNIYFGIEGDDAALRIIKKIVSTIGGRTVIIPKEKKALYHMGGVFSSNFLVALLYSTRNMYAQIGLDENQTFDILFPIVKQTLENVKTDGVAVSLTGPALRKDRAVIQSHLRELESLGSNYQKIYRELTSICYIVAASKNKNKA